MIVEYLFDSNFSAGDVLKSKHDPRKDLQERFCRPAKPKTRSAPTSSAREDENQPKLKKHRLGLEGDRCREPKKANPDSDPNVFEIVSSGDEAGSSSAVTHSQPQSQHRFFRGDTMQSLESEVS